MKSFIGEKETGASLILFSIPSAFLVSIGSSCSSMANGAVINFALSFFICFIFLIPINIYFNKYANQNIITLSIVTFGKVISNVIVLILSLLLLLHASSTLSLFCSSISNLSSFTLRTESVRFPVFFASLICAYLGAEAITRKSYLTFLASGAIIFFLVFISSKGINKDNVYPILGTGLKNSFKSFKFISLGVGFAPLLLISDLINKSKNFKRNLFISFISLFTLVFIMLALYLLTVPYPMGKLFPSSLEAIFASASSGEVMHRFELVLLSLFVFLSVESVSLSVWCISYSLTKITNINDTRPFIFAISPIMFIVSKINFSDTLYLTFSTLLTFFSIIFVVLILIFGKEKV